MEITPFSILALVALTLLVLVSGGVLYLTVAEWRDRRRKDRDKRQDRDKRNR